MAMPKPKWRELKEAIRAVIQGPYTAKFPAEPTPLPDTFRGRPRYQEDDCVGCGGCYNVCPPAAIEMTDDVDAGVRRLTIRLDRCIYCGHCVANCLTEKGVKQTLEYDLATTDRSELRETIEHALVLCETCGAVIGTRDHIRWVADRLGPLAYANPALLLSHLQDHGLADAMPTPTESLQRADQLRVQCPKCRQVTALLA